MSKLSSTEYQYEDSFDSYFCSSYFQDYATTEYITINKNGEYYY